MSRHKVLSRLDVESYGQMLLAARTGVYALGHGQGVSDAAMGRYYAASRTGSADKADYDLGFRVGRFVLYRNLPAWRAPMLSHVDAADLWAAFKASPDARPGDPD